MQDSLHTSRNPLWDQVIEQGQLITLPEVYLRLQQVLSREDFALQDVVEVIQYDPAITTRLLNLVKSAYLGLGPRIDTVSHAVNYLGSDSVHDLVLMTVLADRFSDIHSPHFSLHAFWRDSVQTALLARRLMRLLEPAQAERLFVAGLLHDIGHLAMQQAIPEAMAEIAEQQAPPRPRHEIEREHLGFDSIDIGRELMQHWQLPGALQRIIGCRLQPETAGDEAFSAEALGLAVRLVANPEEPAPAWQDLTPEMLADARSAAKEEMDGVIRLLFPHLP